MVEKCLWSPCYCEDSRNSKENDCLFKEWWPTKSTVALTRESSKSRTTRDRADEHFEGVTDLVTTGSVVVIEAGDAGERYYLMRADAPAFHMDSDGVVGVILSSREL